MTGGTTRLKKRRAKIVATLGPSSRGLSTVDALIAAGVDVFRLNLSHGDHGFHAEAYGTVRDAAHAAGVPVAVLADLCGPKIRTGRFEGGSAEIVTGTRVTVTTRPVLGHAGLIPSEYEPLPREVHPGCRVLLSDGLIGLRVESVEGTEVACTVVHGGRLSDRKGINLPETQLSAPSLTAKDRRDANFAIALGVDFLALSFVRSASDIKELRALVPPGSGVAIIAKIERPEALDDIDAIIEASEGIMVARGDLGVELPPERVPVVQRELVARARARAKPSIVATQMLESMTGHPLPTRAEVSDVSTAVFSGADSVMLSAETAAGRYPVEAVLMMDRIAREVEGYLWTDNGFNFESKYHDEPLAVSDAVARSTAQLSRDLLVRAVVVSSSLGTSARIMSSARPAAPLLAATTSPAVCRQMSLLWGVVPQCVGEADFDRKDDLARHLATTVGLAEPGQRVLSVTGLEKASESPAISIVSI